MSFDLVDTKASINYAYGSDPLLKVKYRFLN